MNRTLPYILLSLLCGVLFVWRLGSVPLIGLDEGLYAECSREMLVSGDYVVPTCNGKLFLDKPPLGYWLQAASMRVFGANSFAARLPSAIASVVLIGFTVFLGHKLYSRRAGLMAGYMLATAILTAWLARLALLDHLFSLAIAVSLGAFLLSYLGFWTRRGYVLFWAAMGVSVLVKGPAGMVLICAIVGAFLLLSCRKHSFWCEILRVVPIAGVLVFLAIVLPWYVIVQVRTGGSFAGEFFVHQNLKRAMGSDFAHNQPFWFYLPVFLAGFFPWSVFVPSGLATQLKQASRDASAMASLFAVIWMVAIIGLFSLSRSKLVHYIFPMYPAAALLVGSMWSREIDSDKTLLLRKYSWAVLVVALLLGVAFQAAPHFLREAIPGLSPVLTAMALSIVIGAIVSIVLLVYKRSFGAFVALCAGMSVFMSIAVLAGLPLASRSLSGSMIEMSRQITDMASKTDAVISYRLSPPQPAMGFYAKRPVMSISDPNDLKKALGGRVSYVVIQDKYFSELPKGGVLVCRTDKHLLYRFALSQSRGN
ncbi:MAG: glycosyltransferase family 39 protein [Armatimonadota bacterium]|nr:glycosyltransferase family 39 protein [bacterium]